MINRDTVFLEIQPTVHHSEVIYVIREGGTRYIPLGDYHRDITPHIEFPVRIGGRYLHTCASEAFPQRLSKYGMYDAIWNGKEQILSTEKPG